MSPPLLVVLFASVCLAALPTRADGQVNTQIFNAQTFHPAIGPENVITVEGSRTPGALRPMAGLLFEFAYRPLRLTSPDGSQSFNTVDSMSTLHVLGGFGVTRWLAFSVDLPVVLYQGFDQTTPTTVVPVEPLTAGVGDLRLLAKLRILDNQLHGFGLAFVPQVSFPTGTAEEFRGDGAYDFEPRFALDYRTRKGIFVALNASVLLRTSDQSAGNVSVSHQVRYGLGAHVPLAAGFGVNGELVGGTSLVKGADGSIYSPLEGYLGARWVHRTGINVNLGGGAALLSAVGSAQFRIFAGVGYLPIGKPAPRRASPVAEEAPSVRPVADPDPDRDGVLGAADRCPTQAGPRENDGCPDTDRDKDGVVDRLDKCPAEAGPRENGGCPDTDNDKDGVVDRLDKCPTQPGPKENDGCPLPDQDQDGVPDVNDKCPDQPGPAGNNGCPEADQDKDGVVDRLDKCPTQPGPKENGGCPVALVEIKDDTIKLVQPIKFAPGSAELDPGSGKVIEALARALMSDPAIKKARFSVSAGGDKKAAKKLAGKRVKTLSAALQDAGVQKKLLQIKAAKEPGGDTVSEAEVQKGKVKVKKDKKDKKDRKARRRGRDG